jgi:hypothetical protein
MPALRFVSSSGFRAGVGPARAAVAAARTSAAIEVVFILLSCLVCGCDTNVELAEILKSRQMVLSIYTPCPYTNSLVSFTHEYEKQTRKVEAVTEC